MNELGAITIYHQQNGEGVADTIFIPFFCQKCGKCCNFDAFMSVGQSIADEWLKVIGLKTVDEFNKKYWLPNKNKSREELKKNPCPFLNEDKTCKIHHCKPIGCKSFPLDKNGYLSERYPLEMKCPGFAKFEKLRKQILKGYRGWHNNYTLEPSEDLCSDRFFGHILNKIDVVELTAEEQIKFCKVNMKKLRVAKKIE